MSSWAVADSSSPTANWKPSGATLSHAAQLFGPGEVGKTGSDPTAIVASGENFPDALAGGPPSFLKRFPILLTAHDALSPQASAALSDLGIKRALLLGGENAVSSAVAAAITAKGIIVDRPDGVADDVHGRELPAR